MSYASLLLAHCAATGFMVGVIWFVQVVHYPLFAQVGRDWFADYAAAHQRRTSFVVIPAMLIEAGTAPLLLLRAPTADRPLVLLALALLLGVWLTTFLQQVPRHRRLLLGYDGATVKGLVVTNAVRTSCWTAKGMVCLWLAVRCFL